MPAVSQETDIITLRFISANVTMRYTIDDYTFNSAKEYEAAKRDKAKLQQLEKHGRSDVEVSLNYRRQMKEKGIHFESRLGRDFEDNINKVLFYEPAGGWTKNDGPVKPQPKKLVLLPLYVTLSLLAAVIVLYFGKEYISGRNMADVQAKARTSRPARVAGTVSADKPRQILPRFAELLKKNPDLVGWLTVPDTIIDYPVMYRENDNDFYLEHDFDKNSDQNGLLVLDKRCTLKGDDVNNLIHGHSMKSGAMFGMLLRYANESYYQAHKQIVFSTLYEEGTYDIVGVFRSSVYDDDTADFQYYNYIQIDSEEDFNSYILGVKTQSLYDTGITAEYGDRLITLSTCEYTKENGRLVVVGRCKK